MTGLGLFARVFLLFVLVCVLPALAVLYHGSRRIDERIRDHNRRGSQVKSLVNSAQAKARNAAALVLRLPEEFLKELAAGRAQPGHTAATLDRLVCPAAFEGLSGEKAKVIGDLLALMDPDPDRPRPADLEPVLEHCIPPLRAYRPDPAAAVGSAEAYRREIRRITSHSRHVEELADIYDFVGRQMPICNYVLLLDRDRKVLAHNRVGRYGRPMPDWTGRPLGRLPGSPEAVAALSAMADRLDAAPKGPLGRMVVADRLEGLDLLGLYTDPDDYRRWSAAVVGDVRPGAGLPREAAYAVFVVNWYVVQSEVVTDQMYKRSRNLDRLRLLVFDADPPAGQAPRAIASGVPGLWNEPVARGGGKYGPQFADRLLDWLASEERDAGAHLFECRPGAVRPPDDLGPPADDDPDAGRPAEVLIGAFRTVAPPAEPAGWRVLASPSGGRPFAWAAAIYYDLDEGSVAPAVRGQVYLLGALLTAVMLAACWLVARMISRPIARLRGMVADLAEGRRSPAEEPDNGLAWTVPREIRDLDRAFREMAGHVVSKRRLEDTNRELSEKNRRLDEAVAELTRARDELQAGRRELEDKARTLEQTIARLNNTQQELMVSNVLASLGVISGEYAHAVNNGLQLPLATLQQLEAGLPALHLPEHTREDVIASVESLKQTADFVTQFRDFARNDSYALFPTDLNRVVQTVAAGWKPQLKRKQIELETQLGEPPAIRGNDSLLMHVLLNLLLNARDAIRERRKNPDDRRLVGRIVLRTCAEGPAAMLSITDNGCGIPPEIAPRLFQAMFTTKPKGEGSGLGLSSVLRAVRQHKGEIWFESKPGQGTTFFIRIPRLDPDDKGPRSPDGSSGSRPRVML
jgi:signal transduction histidine kinase